jgi:hypothetical protein
MLNAFKQKGFPPKCHHQIIHITEVAIPGRIPRLRIGTQFITLLHILQIEAAPARKAENRHTLWKATILSSWRQTVEK